MAKTKLNKSRRRSSAFKALQQYAEASAEKDYRDRYQAAEASFSAWMPRQRCECHECMMRRPIIR